MNPLRVLYDGTVCYSPYGACFEYYRNLSQRLVLEPDVSVVITPSPTDALRELEREKVTVQKQWVPMAPSWLPRGPLRKALSAVRRATEGLIQRRPSPTSTETLLFQSFFYSPPPGRIPQVTMVLDMIAEKFPDRDSLHFSVSGKKRAAVDSALGIIAISDHTKHDLCELWGVKPSRVEVIPLAVDHAFFAEKADTFASLQKKYDLSRPYALQIGGRLNHKNFPRLLEAFALSKAHHDLDLLCAGELISEPEKALMRKLGIESRVKHAHYPNRFDLRTLLQHAEMFVYPSLYEGFGLPPLEAMASGTPVAASKGSAIEEISGTGALLFDPMDPTSMASAIEALLDPTTAAKYRDLGHGCVRQYTWEHTSRMTLNLYRRLVAEV